MAIANFTDLKTEIASWLARTDIATKAETIISLGEAGLNRDPGPIETETTLTGTVDSRSIDISALSCMEPGSLFVIETSGTEREPIKLADGTFPYHDATGCPTIWAVDGDRIDFDYKLDQAYSFRFRFKQRFALSESAPTNWLLTNHPDIYLAACAIYGSLFVKNPTQASVWKQVLDNGIPQVRHQIAQKQRGVSVVDPMLSYIGRQGRYAL